MSSSTETKKQKYLEALLTSNSIKEACSKANISRATAQRYAKDADFQKMYHAMQRKTMEFTSNKLRSLASKAVESLSDILDDYEATPADKTRAAKIILDSAFHVQESEDILQRLDKLESEVDS